MAATAISPLKNSHPSCHGHPGRVVLASRAGCPCHKNGQLLLFQRAAIAAILSLLWADYACASEIVLRGEYQCQGPVVTLGDIAEVLGADQRANKQLSSVELFPAPAAGRQRFVRVREIQDILASRGVNLAKHRFSGANQLALSRGERAEQVVYEKPILASARRTANRRVHDAVLDYLRSSVSDSKWNVQLTLASEQIRLFEGPVCKLTVSGGMSPWVGRQHFLLTVARNDQRPLQLPVEAQVSLPPSVVVANRDIPRDTIIAATDLVLSSEVPRHAGMETFSNIEEAVGRQAARAIAAGAIIDSKWVVRPLLVRRREIVTVTARAAGVRVSTNARARADGSLGDLIPVESLQDRKTYYARVCGSRQVEVFSPTIRTPQASRPAAWGPEVATSGRSLEAQLSQPRSVQNNKLQRLAKVNWK